MSNLHKFHRRTTPVGPVAPPAIFPTRGSGSNTIGYWVGGTLQNKIIVAPKTTYEGSLKWGFPGTLYKTSSLTDGTSNTTTMNSIGSQAASWCKQQTLGGYNNWYLPAKDELTNIVTYNDLTPFATANKYTVSDIYWSSTEKDSTYAWCLSVPTTWVNYKKSNDYKVRPVRKTTVM